MEKKNIYVISICLRIVGYLRHGHPMLPVCLNCQILIVSSVFSNVYIETCWNSVHRICYNRNNNICIITTWTHTIHSQITIKYNIWDL